MESKYTITRIRNSRKDIQNNGKKLEETNGVIKSRKSEKDIQQKKDKTTNNDLQNIHIKLKIE